MQRLRANSLAVRLTGTLVAALAALLLARLGPALGAAAARLGLVPIRGRPRRSCPGSRPHPGRVSPSAGARHGNSSGTAPASGSAAPTHRQFRARSAAPRWRPRRPCRRSRSGAVRWRWNLRPSTCPPKSHRACRTRPAWSGLSAGPMPPPLMKNTGGATTGRSASRHSRSRLSTASSPLTARPRPRSTIRRVCRKSASGAVWA